MARDTSVIFSRRALIAPIALSLLAFASGCASSSDDGAGSAGADLSASTAGFLADDAISDIVKIAPAFPFGAVARHAATGPALDAHWGRHGGPIVTTQPPSSAQKVTRWAIPSGVSDAATKTDITSFIAPNLPKNTFWSVDGFSDLAFDSLALNAYSSDADNFAGEALFYSKDYDAVVGRASVNGFYSGTGITDGSKKRLVYSGLSGLTSAVSSTKDNAFWASDVCNGSPAPSGSCAPSVKLFGWTGSSGPVTTDADGNVFVAAFVTGAGSPAPETDTIYGLTKSQSFAATATPQATLSQKKTGGTASLAAVTKPGSGKGWLIAKGHDDKTAAPSYAVAYTSSGTALATSGTIVDNAITGVSPDASLSFFADPQGNLWVAVELPSGSTFLELAARP